MSTIRERHPEVFKTISTDSPRGKTRSVPMECLCLGFNRTGTATMHVATGMLGMHCWHSITFFAEKFQDIEMWQEAVDRKFFGAPGPQYGRAEFDQLLHDFNAISSDTPAIAFAEELIRAYPEAKVVLVERDIDSWYRSFINSVVASLVCRPGPLYNPFNRFAATIDRWYLHPIEKVQRDTFRGWMGFNSAEEAAAIAKDKYREHYALVRRVTPKERLLEFKLSDGWEPLCEFLGKPVPAEPFPHVNDQKFLEEKISAVIGRGLKMLAWRVSIVCLPVVVAVWALGLWRR